MDSDDVLVLDVSWYRSQVWEGANTAEYAPSTTTTNKTCRKRILIETNRRKDIEAQLAYIFMENKASPGLWGGCGWSRAQGS